jgi:hypothetical protein
MLAIRVGGSGVVQIVRLLMHRMAVDLLDLRSLVLQVDLGSHCEVIRQFFLS